MPNYKKKSYKITLEDEDDRIEHKFSVLSSDGKIGVKTITMIVKSLFAKISQKYGDTKKD